MWCLLGSLIAPFVPLSRRSESGRPSLRSGVTEMSSPTTSGADRSHLWISVGQVPSERGSHTRLAFSGKSIACASKLLKSMFGNDWQGLRP